MKIDEIREARREVARIQTILRERASAEHAKSKPANARGRESR